MLLTQLPKIGSLIIIYMPLSIELNRWQDKTLKKGRRCQGKGVGTAPLQMRLPAAIQAKDVAQFFPVFQLLSHCLQFRWVEWRVASGSVLAVVYSGKVILCLWRLNKELIVDKFRHFSSAVFGLSPFIRVCLSLRIVPFLASRDMLDF